MSDLTPITREEALLDGQDLEPITRKEQFIKRIYDKTQEIPEPITREECFLKKAGEGTSPVTIEQLNATENGTYSEPGKAYSPVIVEVPEPTLISKSITANGTYSASADNADGYSQVTVNVPYMEKKSASGDIASFSDGAGYPFLKVKANINPVQDLHGYDYPWVGGAGVNKLPVSVYSTTQDGITYTATADGKIKISGTATAGGSILVNLSDEVTIQNGQYLHMRNDATGASVVVDMRFKSGNRCTPTFTSINRIFDLSTSAGEVLNQFGITYPANETIDIIFQPSIESDSTDTAYSPYSNICPISGFTGVNVANVADKVQYFKGLLDGTYGFVDMGTLAWVRNGTYSFFSCQISDKKASASGGIICEKYTYGGGKGDSEMSNVPTGIYAGYNTKEIKVKDTAYTDAQTFKTAMNGVYLIYELATPTTPTITPTQFNNLLAEFSIGGAIYPISWQDEAGIVYGGYIDLVSGVLTVTKVGVDLGTLSWNKHTGGYFSSGGLENVLINNTALTCMSDAYMCVKGSSFSPSGDAKITISTYVSTLRPLVVWDSNKTEYDTTTFKNSMSGVQLVYELATPQTYQLTPQQINTLIGQNNAWNNTNGQTEVEYFIPIE